VSEFTLTIHLVIFKKTSVLMTLCPTIGALTFLAVVLEVSLIASAVRVRRKTVFAVSFVVGPLALIFSHYAVHVSLAVIKL
jgi:hypothetical protein